MRAKIFLFLIFGVGIFAALPLVSATGCCLAELQCYNEADTVPSGGGATWTQDFCYSLQYTWLPEDCDVYRQSPPDDQCVSGCCCPEEGGDGKSMDSFACAEPNTFAPGDLYCASCTGTGTTYYQLSGHVYDANANPVGSGVTVTTNPGSQSTTTNGESVYTFLLPAGVTYVLSAGDGTCTGSITVTLTQDLVADIALDDCPPIGGYCGDGVKDPDEQCDGTDFGGQTCTSLGYNDGGTLVCSDTCTTIDEGGCNSCVSDWQCDWSDNVDGVDCGYPTNCNDLNNCREPYDPAYAYDPPMPVLPVECSNLCNNGQIDPGEACDPSVAATTSCAAIPAFGFVSGTATCTSSCQWDTSDCSDCPENENQCDQAACDQGCAICTAWCASQVPADCDDLAAEIQSIQSIQYTPTARVTWMYPSDKYNRPINNGQYTCGSRIEQVTVDRCESSNGNSCDPNGATQSFTISPVTNNYGATLSLLDGHLLAADQSYCYQITTWINGPNGVVTTESLLDCFTTGSQVCMDGLSTETCTTLSELSGTSGYTGPNIRAVCDVNNKLVPLSGGDCAGLACFGPFADGKTICGDSAACGFCNGVFGMFSYIGGLELPWSTAINCQSSEIIGGSTPLCHQSQTMTAAPEYDDCSKVRSCYDYRDENSCVHDGCNNLAEDCVWNTLAPQNSPQLGEELGIGVCAPADENLQDCSRCDDDQNFGAACSKNLCTLYGPDRCYFDAIHSYPPVIINNPSGTCLDKQKMGCSYYDTEEDCIASSESINICPSGDDSCAVELDVTYNGMDRIGGSNAITTSSKDRFNYGTCEWSSVLSRCFKNADGYTSITDPARDDCMDSYLDQSTNFDCYADNAPPITEVLLRPTTNPNIYPLYASGEKLVLSSSASDDVYAESDLKTRFSLTPTGVFDVLMSDFPAPPSGGILGTPAVACEQFNAVCTGQAALACGDGHWMDVPVTCDQSIFSQIKTGSLILPFIEGDINPLTCAWQAKCQASSGDLLYPDKTISELQSLRLPSADYTLSYYSVDGALNLEQVKTVDLTIDARAPELQSLSITDTPLEISTDDWRSDVAITYTVSDAHGPSTCQHILTKPLLPDFTLPSTWTSAETFSQNYVQLTDGDYLLSITCKDALDNEVTYAKSFTLDADKSITNPQPSGFETLNIIDVPISIDTKTPGTCYYSSQSTTPVDNPEGTFDSSDGLHHTKTVTVDPNSLYVYFTGCQFDNGRLVQGDSGDAITFAVDQVPPKTTIIDEATSLPYVSDPDVYSSELTLSASCIDTYPGLQDYSFGPKEIRYCIGPADCIPENLLTDPLTITFADVASGNHFRYLCEDLGGNIESVNDALLYLKDVTFAGPQVFLCEDPEDDSTCQEATSSS